MKMCIWSELSVDMVCQEHEVMGELMLMRHLANSVMRSSRGGVPVENTIVRSVDSVGHSFSSCIGQS